MKAAEPRRLTYGRASRRGTAAAAAGGSGGPFDLAGGVGRRAGRDRRTLRKRGLAPSDVRFRSTCSSRAPAPR